MKNVTKNKILSKLRYPIEDDKSVIEIKVHSLDSLFDEHDPSPYMVRDLDNSIMEYIAGCVLEITPGLVGKLRFHSEDFFDLDKQDVFVKSIKDFFLLKAHMEKVKIQQVFKRGFFSLMIGLTFLTSAIFASFTIHSASPEFWTAFLKEGLHLLGWVSMWTPISLFLYDWWEPFQDLKVYRRLSQVDIEIVFSSYED
jgi:hypothetical protein